MFPTKGSIGRFRCAHCSLCKGHYSYLYPLFSNPPSCQSLLLSPFLMLVRSPPTMRCHIPFLAKSTESFYPCKRSISIRVRMMLILAVAVAKWVPASVCAGRFSTRDHGASARATSHLTVPSHLVCMGNNGQVGTVDKHQDLICIICSISRP